MGNIWEKPFRFFREIWIQVLGILLKLYEKKSKMSPSLDFIPPHYVFHK